MADSVTQVAATAGERKTTMGVVAGGPVAEAIGGIGAVVQESQGDL